MLVELDDLDVFELLLEAESESKPAGIVRITTLPEVQLALDRVLNLFFFVGLLAFTALLLLGFGSLVDLPVLAHEQVAVFRVELAKLLERRNESE